MEERYSQPLLRSYKYAAFKPLNTTVLLSSILVASFILTSTGVLSTIFVMDPEKRCIAFFKLIYGQAGLWLFTLVGKQCYIVFATF